MMLILLILYYTPTLYKINHINFVFLIRQKCVDNVMTICNQYLFLSLKMFIIHI